MPSPPNARRAGVFLHYQPLQRHHLACDSMLNLDDAPE